ncbi:MAG: tetratricopeptide repeat protein [Candidatus Firestonebacteria bacterium]
MIAAAYTLGIPHPPGYPLYTILSKLMTFIPVAGIAFRVNLLAGLFGALSCSLLFLLLKTLRKTFHTNYKDAVFELTAFLLTLVFAFSRTYWAQSVQAKGGLYTLNIFLIIILFLLIIKNRNLISIGIISGLGLANHNTFVPVVLILFYCYYVELKRNLAEKRLKIFLSAMAVSLFIAAVLYLYLFVRAKANPLLNWGDPSSLTNLFHHIFRSQYGTISEKTRSLEIFLGQSSWLFKNMFLQFTVIPCLLAIPGFFFIYRKRKDYFFVFILIFIFLTFGLTLMANFAMNAINLYMIEVFFLPAYMVLIIFAVFGTAEIYSKLPRLWNNVLLFSLGGLAIFCIFSNYYYSDRSKNFFAYDYGINLLKSAEKQGMLLVAGDNTAFSTAYLTMVEKKAPEYTIYDDYGLLFRNNDADLKKIPATDYLNRLDYVKKLLLTSGRPVYFVLGSHLHRDIYTILSKEYKASPSGLLFKVMKKTEKLNEFYYSSLSFRGISDNNIFKDTLVNGIIAQYHYFFGEYLKLRGKQKDAEKHFAEANKYGENDEQIQNMLGVSSQESGNTYDAFDKAKKAVDIDPHSPEAWNNYGVALEHIGDLKSALFAYQKAVSLDKNELQYLNNFAGACFNAGDFPEAVNTYLKISSINERTVNYNGLGMSYYKLGKTAEAEAAYKKGLSFGTSFELNMGFANLYINTGRPSEAIKYYREALNINPAGEKAYNNMGVAYLQLNNLAQGEKMFLKAIGKNPNFIEGYVNLVKVCYASGRKDEALKFCEKILSLDPKNAFAISVIGQLKKIE